MKLPLLQVRFVEIRDEDHIKRLVRKHKDQLGAVAENLDDQAAIAKIQAISYNIVHLTRELERIRLRRANIRVVPDKKD